MCCAVCTEYAKSKITTKEAINAFKEVINLANDQKDEKTIKHVRLIAKQLEMEEDARLQQIYDTWRPK